MRYPDKLKKKPIGEKIVGYMRIIERGLKRNEETNIYFPPENPDVDESFAQEYVRNRIK